MTTPLLHQESCDELLHMVLPSSEKHKNYMSNNPEVMVPTKPRILQDLPTRSTVKHGKMLGVKLKGLWKLIARHNRSECPQHQYLQMYFCKIIYFAHLSDLVSSVLLALLGCWSVSNNVPHQSLGIVEKLNQEARVLVPETWVSVNCSVSGHQCLYQVLSTHSESNINSLYRNSTHITHQQYVKLLPKLKM